MELRQPAQGQSLSPDSELHRLARAGKCAGARPGLGRARAITRAGRPLAEDVLLVVEVADSSLGFDTGEKADLYAAAGIADYWVVDVVASGSKSAAGRSTAATSP